MQRATLPGFYLHFVLRKRCIESCVRSAIQNSTDQLIIIGAGFDTLGMSIANDFPTVSVLEIDHPATLSRKQSAITAMNLQSTNLQLLPANLTHHSLQETLLGSTQYDKTRSSIFIAEGLTMYLSEQEVRDIFHCISSISTQESQLIFTYMEEDRHGKYNLKNTTHIATLWLRLVKEEFKWGLKRDDLTTFLKESDLNLEKHYTHHELRSEFLSKPNMATALSIGENVAVAKLKKREMLND